MDKSKHTIVHMCFFCIDLMQEDIQASSIIRFSTERSLDDIAQTLGIDVDPSSLQPFYDYLNTVVSPLTTSSCSCYCCTHTKTIYEV